jgi:hypothetical protein
MRLLLRFIRVPAVVSALFAFAVSSHAAPGLTLGGHFIPQESLMVFIDMGNSAMSGREKTPDLVTEPHLWKFEMNPANHDWLAAKEPVCVDAYNSLNAPLGGPIMPFLKQLHVDYPNFYFGVMQLSNSGWELTGHFNAGAGDVTALLTQANILKANVTIAGIVCMLNTVEVQNKDTANYLQKVADMVSNVRTNLGTLQYKGVAYTVPYIHAGYPILAKDSPDGTIQYDTSHAQTKSIMRQIAQIPTKVSNCVIIPTDGLTVCMNCTPSGYYDHYDHAGNVGWGTRTADTVLARNWIPPCTNCVGITTSLQHQIAPMHVSVLQKIMFDGTNWSAFDKAGKSFSVYSPNGRAITGASAAALRNQKLLPGIYFVKSQSR